MVCIGTHLASLQNLPIIVGGPHDSIREHSNRRSTVLRTKKNLKDFVDTSVLLILHAQELVVGKSDSRELVHD